MSVIWSLKLWFEARCKFQVCIHHPSVFRRYWFRIWYFTTLKNTLFHKMFASFWMFPAAYCKVLPSYHSGRIAWGLSLVLQTMLMTKSSVVFCTANASTVWNRHSIALVSKSWIPWRCDCHSQLCSCNFHSNLEQMISVRRSRSAYCIHNVLGEAKYSGIR